MKTFDLTIKSSSTVWEAMFTNEHGEWFAWKFARGRFGYRHSRNLAIPKPFGGQHYPAKEAEQL